MAAPYKRRRSAGFLRNLWIYRRLVAAAIVAGLTGWFILVNNTPVEVRFPFGFGPWKTSSGLAILLGAAGGSVATGLVVTLLLTMRRFRGPGVPGDDADHSAIPEDRPPTDYAAKAKEGFGERPWSE